MNAFRADDMSNGITPGELEKLLGDTIERVADMHETQAEHSKLLAEIPDMKTLLHAVVSNQTSMVQSQSSMADSAKQMAEAFKKSEDRQEKLEGRYEKASETAAGKDQIPLKSHYITVAMVAFPAFAICFGLIVYILYITKTDLSASLTAIQINQQKTQQIVQEKAAEIREKVEESSPDVKFVPEKKK